MDYTGHNFSDVSTSNNTLPWDSEFKHSLFYLNYNLFALNGTNLRERAVLDLSQNESIWKFIIQGVILCLVTGLGTIGNILSIIVCFNNRMRSSISCLLIGLAICDSLLLIGSMLQFGIPTILSLEFIYPQATSVYLMIGYAIPITYPITITAFTGSVYFTVAITLERFIIVCYPFLARRICTWKRATQASCIIFIATILYNIPRWFEYFCVPVYDDGKNLGCRITATEFKKNSNFTIIFMSLYFTTHFLIPISCLIVFNLLIYFKIREANKSRKNLSVSEVKENSLAHMLFIVVAVFLLCNSSFGVFTIYAFVKWGQPFQDPNPIVLFISTFLIAFNSSVNFLIYCSYGEKFREVFYDIISEPWRRLTGSRKRSADSNCSEPGYFHQSGRTLQSQSVTTILSEPEV